MSVPKVPFQVVGDRLDFYNVAFSIAKAKLFQETYPSQIRITSRTMNPDEEVRMDLMLKNADDVKGCAAVLQTQIPRFDINKHPFASAYTSHFEIFPDRIQQIRVPFESFYLEIQPEQMDMVVAIAERARIVTSNHDTASAELNERIHGKRRADLRQKAIELTSACQSVGHISDDMARKWGTLIEALQEMEKGDGEYLTPDEFEKYRNLFSTYQPEEAQDPYEKTVFRLDDQGDITASSLFLQPPAANGPVDDYYPADESSPS
ncbi:MAG TPA: hypothetical protein VLE89_06020 [Chlamydiales bacterium]|nr:hypothetical protein [Chlamydiales bacterium]